MIKGNNTIDFLLIKSSDTNVCINNAIIILKQKKYSLFLFFKKFLMLYKEAVTKEKIGKE